MKKGYSEADLFDLLSKRYAGSAYAVLRQVRNHTGYGARERTADAVVLSLWPSRGLWAAGFEIKSDLNDLRRELLKPEKAEEIARFMSYWWLILADRSWLDKLEMAIPDTWGILCPDDNGGKLLVVREAPVLEPQPWTAAFVCSVVREAARQVTEEAQLKPRLDKSYSEGYAKGFKDGNESHERQLPHQLKRLEELSKSVDEFQKRSGIKGIDQWSGPEIGTAVSAVQRMIGFRPDGKAPQAVREIEKISNDLLRLSSEISRIIFGEEHIHSDEGEEA